MNNQPEFLPYGRQTIDDDDIVAVAKVLRSDFLTTGPAVEAFEAALCKHTGAIGAIACSSGTAALHLATLTLDLGPGDWVVVPAITFVATANAVRYTGADVIFADVDPDSGLMTSETLEAALKANRDKDIRAVMPVHLAGQPADLGAIATIAHSRNLAVIEDASHALGTSYPSAKNAKMLAIGGCADSDMTVFSFHPVKTVTCGEGGAVMTNNPKMAERLRLLRNHGMTRVTENFANDEMAFDCTGSPNPWYYEMAELGYNYRLTDIHAALGLSQLGKLNHFVSQRQKLVKQYDKHLKGLAPYLRPISRTKGCKVSWHLYLVLIDFNRLGLNRAEIMIRLREMGIGTQVHYIPVSSQPYYRKRYGKKNLPGGDCYYAQTLSLPLHPKLSENDVDRVVEALEIVFKQKHS